MKKRLYIAKGGADPALTIPADALTRTFGIFGQKHTGKTTTARVLVEEMTSAGGHVLVFDPVGVWWGVTREGEGRGVPGIVIGGKHGDVPLEETGGQLVAELALGRHWPVVVVDMRLMRKGAQLRFLADALEGLFFGSAAPLHVVFEEADRELPQSPRGMDPTMGRVLGAAEDIVKLGRSRGLGTTLVSQRFATVNKNVVEQVESLILHRFIGPNDRKAAKAWIESNGDPAVTDRVLDSLATLKRGEAWVYSPGWLELLQRVMIRAPRTLDTMMTPEDEVEIDEGAARAPVDLNELRDRMADTVERAKENDPGELRTRIRELEAELEGEPREVEVEVRVPDREAVAQLSEAVASLDAGAEELARIAEEFDQQVGALNMRIAQLRLERDAVGASLDQAGAAQAERVETPRPRREGAAAPELALDSNGDLSSGARQLLTVLVRLYPARLTRTQWITLAGRGRRSSTVSQQLTELRDRGMIQTHHNQFEPSEAAFALFGGKPKVRSGVDRRAEWEQALPDGPRALLDVLVGTPRGLPRDELFKAAGFSPTSSTPVTHLKLLVDNQVAVREGQLVLPGPAIS